MEIQNYALLISNLPVMQQCFTTKRATWQNAENEFEWLKQMNDNLFGTNSSMTISRQDIFETANTREKIIKTIYWGYTSGMRGNNFIKILDSIDIIESELLSLSSVANHDSNDFQAMATKFKNVSGLGLSTYSKLLYFFNISYNGNPCLILDQRLIDVFARDLFLDFQNLRAIRYYRAESMYLEFLSVLASVSARINTDGEKIELFLFTFGNNLKE
jgi:hypothetical protein